MAQSLKLLFMAKWWYAYSFIYTPMSARMLIISVEREPMVCNCDDGAHLYECVCIIWTILFANMTLHEANFACYSKLSALCNKWNMIAVVSRWSKVTVGGGQSQQYFYKDIFVLLLQHTVSILLNIPYRMLNNG